MTLTCAQILSSSRERTQQLSRRVLLLSQHCSLILHTTLLLCLCEAFTQLDQLRNTRAIRTLPVRRRGGQISGGGCSIRDTELCHCGEKGVLVVGRGACRGRENMYRKGYQENQQLAYVSTSLFS